MLAAFFEDEIIVIIRCVPKPISCLFLMDRGVEFCDRAKRFAADKFTLIPQFLEVIKNIKNSAGIQMPAFALENQNWRLLFQNSGGAFEDLLLRPLHVDFYDANPNVCRKIFVKRNDRDRHSATLFARGYPGVE